MRMLGTAMVLIAIMFALVLMSPRRGTAQVGTVIPTPSPIPTPIATPRPGTLSRNFYCNCSSAGQPVLWAGNVQATSYFQARQLATNQCLAYLGAKPVSPLIPTPALAFGAQPTFAPLAVNVCGSCACN
jgi:hypothetical protein